MATSVSETRALGGKRYLLLLWMGVALLYASVFALLRVPFYDVKVGDSWGPILDYGYAIRNFNADVVVFGDSSALFGIDPLQMEQDLGVKVINLPNTAGSLPVTNDLALRSYREHNRPPRLILFYFSPWQLDYAQDSHNSFVFEGEEMLVRNGTLSQILSYLRKSPTALLAFPFEYYLTATRPLVRSLFLPRSGAEMVASTHGHIVPESPVSMHACAYPRQILSQTATTSAEELLRRYKTTSTLTMLYLAPVPDCRGVSELRSRVYLGGTVKPPASLPAQLFLSDGHYVHMMPGSVEQSTQLLDDALRPVIKSLPVRPAAR